MIQLKMTCPVNPLTSTSLLTWTLMTLTLVSEFVTESARSDLISYPKDQTVKLGSTVTLKCAADTKQETQVDWYHNGNKIAQWEKEWTQTTLSGKGKSVNSVNVHMLSFSAQVEPIRTLGLYGCTLRNSQGSTTWKSKNATISISTNENFVKVPEDKQILLGEIATLSCELKSSFQRGTSITWFHNGRKLDISPKNERITSDQFGLQIRRTEERDEGTYYCVASKAGSENITSSNGSIRIVYPPRVDPNGVMSMTGFVSQSVTLGCPMLGKPRVSCYWSRVGERDIPVTRAMQTDNRLVIGHVQSSDEGDYMCQCENEFGENRVIVELKVPTILEFASAPVDTVALVGHSVQIPCLVRTTAANEQGVTIVWDREESPSDIIFQGETVGNKQVLKNGTLIIRNVTQDDRGYYTCKALQPTANAQQIDERIFVEVRSHTNMRPPIITKAPFNHTMRVGGRLRLPCAASSESAVTITWRFQNDAWRAALGNTRTTDSRITTEQNGALSVTDVKLEDTGLYKCIASTSAGTSERTAIIIVKPNEGLMKSPDFDELPLAVGKPIITRVTENSVTLNWNPGNNPSPEYNVEMYSYETHVFAWSTVGDGIYSNLLTVGRLSPDEDYEFLVRGVNKLGVGLPSPVSSRVRTVERNSDASITGLRDEEIKSQIVLVEVEALEGTTVNSTSAWIQWNVLHNSYFVQGFTIKYTEHDGGNAYPSQKYKVVEVNDPYARAVLVGDLQPWSSYMATIQPYYESIPGIDSQHIFFTTPEGTPRDIVSDVTLHQMSGGKYMVTWSAPFKQREGHIIGYSVALYFGDSDIPFRTLNTTDTKCPFSIEDRPDNFRVSIAARTNAGVGVFSPLVSPNDIPVQTTKTSWIIEHPWVLAIAGALVWIALAIVSILIWRRHKRGHYKSVRAVKLEQSLQPPSEYAGGQWQVILPPSAQHNMTLMHGAYMPQGPSGTLCPPQTMASSQGGPDVGHFMGGSMGMGNMPVTLKSATNSNYAAHPECYQPLVVNISSHKNPNESLYQCGDCYEECNPVQCNNHPTVQLPPCNNTNTTAATTSAHQQQQHPNANAQCSCQYSNHQNIDPNNISVVYHPNSSPEYHQHPNTMHQCHAPGTVQNPQGAFMATPKFNSNPNRYQQTPPRRSPAENLYNELDQPKMMSGAQSPHHYEVYDSEMMHSPVGTSPGSNQSYPISNNSSTTPNRLQQQQGYPLTVLPSTIPPSSVTTCTNLSLPPHPVAANTLSNQQQQQPPQIAPTISAQVSLAQQSPAQPPRMSCPRMGLSGVNRVTNVNNSLNNAVNNMASSNDYVNTNTTSIATNAPIGTSLA